MFFVGSSFFIDIACVGKVNGTMATVDRGVWQRIIEKVISSGGNLIRPWFTKLDPLSLEHGLLEILVPGEDEKTYCQRHVSRLFTEAAQEATGRLVGVCFLTSSDESGTYESSSTPTPFYEPDHNDFQLSDEYSFDTFVTGPCNRLAHAASVAVSDGPGQTYNPLFLHGSVGLGKTHLLQAVCGKVFAAKPDVSVCLLSCETFVNHFIQSVEQGKLHSFRYRYRHADILAIDDIQFLADHEQTQEEFFHTFNTLYQDHKQIILSSDRSPAEMKNLEERLISRFNWGLVVRIDRPCYETRVAIVHKKARLRSISLPDDVACFIAGQIDSNTRELEGAIAKTAMLAQVLGKNIDLAVAEQAIGTTAANQRREVSIEDILKVVTTRFNVRLSDLQSKKRSRSIAFPRQVCMYLARSMTRHSLEEIGGYFGGRDHTTVLHANRTIESLKGTDSEFHETLQSISREINSSV